MNRTALKKSLLIIIGIMLTPLALELMLRLGGAVYLGSQEIKNIVSLKKEGVYRIMCLGESTTAYQYPLFLQQELNRISEKRKYAVIDKGVPGTDTFGILEALKSNLKKYRPQMVVAMIGINDDENTPRYTEIPEKKNIRLIIKNMRVLKLIRLLKLHLMSNLTGIDVFEDAGTRVPVEVKIDELKKELETSHDKSRVYLELARHYEFLSDHANAEKMYEKSFESDPGNAEAYYGLALMSQNDGFMAKAESMYRKVLELDPGHIMTHYNLGWVHYKLKRMDTALEFFKKAVAFNPNFEMGYLGLAWTYMDLDMYEKAVRISKEGIENNSYSIKLYYMLVQAYEMLGDDVNMEKAQKEIRRMESRMYTETTRYNYIKLKSMLHSRGITLVCMQYPLMSIDALEDIFDDVSGIVFIDNNKVFREALKQGSFADYFRDMCFGNFGHCNKRGNSLIAKNAARVLIDTLSGKDK